MQRRTLISLSLATATVLSAGSWSGVAAAEDLTVDDHGDPFTFVVNLSNVVLERIRADETLRAGDIESLRKLVDSVILPVTDFTMMTRMTVGPKWRQATSEQRKALEEGFENLLMRVYAGALSAVKDQRCELRPTRSKKVQPEMVIRTLLTSASGATAQPIALDYRIYQNKEGAWKIVDVNVEGIWMVENYRSQFSGVLSRDGVEGLVKLLTEKSEELAESMRSKTTGASK